MSTAPDHAYTCMQARLCACKTWLSMMQTMVLFDYGLRSKVVQAKLQALEGWVQLLVALAAHAPSHLKTIANQVWRTF